MDFNLCLILEMGKVKERALMANPSDTQLRLIVENQITQETEGDDLLKVEITPASGMKTILP